VPVFIGYMCQVTLPIIGRPITNRESFSIFLVFFVCVVRFMLLDSELILHMLAERQTFNMS